MTNAIILLLIFTFLAILAYGVYREWLFGRRMPAPIPMPLPPMQAWPGGEAANYMPEYSYPLVYYPWNYWTKYGTGTPVSTGPSRPPSLPFAPWL